jgi:hypothetical protein
MHPAGMHGGLQEYGIGAVSRAIEVVTGKVAHEREF